jgi:hypothetical protein
MSAIEPRTVTTTQTITSFKVKCSALTLFESAAFSIFCFDANDIMVSTDRIELSTEEYLKWQNDDEYIIQLIATKLGFVLAPS